MISYTNKPIKDVERHLELCFQLIQNFEWLLDSYVLDYFTESHWEKLPRSWQKTVDQLSERELGQWLNGSSNLTKNVLPLSLICLREASKNLTLPRSAVSDTKTIINFLENSGKLTNEQPVVFRKGLEELSSCGSQHNGLDHVFRKHVKPKKQHEIYRLAKTCSILAKSTDCSAAVDVGAGVGHLARLLNYSHGLKMFCLEAVSDYSSSADKFDEELETFFSKRLLPAPSQPKHVVLKLKPDTQAQEFMDVIDEATGSVNNTRLTHGLVGLHTCGDLAPTLIRLFTRTPTIKFLVSVGCCYMKIDQTRPVGERGYPLSEFARQSSNNRLSYEALEVGCHAFETYCDRLLQSDAEKLKIHCYRAVLECFLVQLNPPVRRAGLRSVKNAHLLTFRDYARKALERLDFDINVEELDLDDAKVSEKLNHWKRVVAFYSLRLLLAPVVETAVLLDRLIFLHEQGFDTCIVPLFDPRLSPRNSVLIAVK